MVMVQVPLYHIPFLGEKWVCVYLFIILKRKKVYIFEFKNQFVEAKSNFKTLH
jgi:hypothetical protein